MCWELSQQTPLPRFKLCVILGWMWFLSGQLALMAGGHFPKSKSSRIHLPEEAARRTQSNRRSDLDKESAGSRALKVRRQGHKILSLFGTTPDRRHGTDLPHGCVGRGADPVLLRDSSPPLSDPAPAPNTPQLSKEPACFPARGILKLGQLKEERRAKRLKKASVTRHLLMCKALF